MRKIEPKVESYNEGPSMMKSTKEETKTYPHLRLQHEFFPETKKWEVGKEYTVKVKVKMTGLSISKFENDSEFDIVGFDSGSESEEKEKPVKPKID